MKERSATLLPRLLKTERNGSSSELLLVIRRWAEFFLRFHKTSAECYQRLQELNLEVGRVARKEKNVGLSSRFLLRCHTGRPPNNSSSLQNFLSNHDFFTPGVTGTAERIKLWAKNMPSKILIQVKEQPLCVKQGSLCLHWEAIQPSWR